MKIAEYTFRKVDGTWIAINNDKQVRTTLEDYLKKIDLLIDDTCQFGIFIKYHNKYKYTITYRAYNMSKVTITVTREEYE